MRLIVEGHRGSPRRVDAGLRGWGPWGMAGYGGDGMRRKLARLSGPWCGGGALWGSASARRRTQRRSGQRRDSGQARPHNHKISGGGPAIGMHAGPHPPVFGCYEHRLQRPRVAFRAGSVRDTRGTTWLDDAPVRPKSCRTDSSTRRSASMTTSHWSTLKPGERKLGSVWLAPCRRRPFFRD